MYQSPQATSKLAMLEQLTTEHADATKLTVSSLVGAGLDIAHTDLLATRDAGVGRLRGECAMQHARVEVPHVEFALTWFARTGPSRGPQSIWWVREYGRVGGLLRAAGAHAAFVAAHQHQHRLSR